MKPIYKLGCLPHDPIKVARCVQAHDILNLSVLPETPAAFDWSQKDGTNLVYPMHGNNYAGDCVFASACHMLGTWTGQTGQQEAITEAQAIDAYSRFTGYNPATGANDNGAVMLDVAKRWAKGENIAGHVIKAFVSVDTKRLDLVAAASNLFGGLWTGWALPTAWQGADEWTAGPNTDGKWAPYSWGGHAVQQTLYSPGMLGIKTWTEDMPVTPAAWDTYCGEAYALISQDTWLRLAGACPAGVDLQKLIDLLPVVGA
jgi:hypothetical protein